MNVNKIETLLNSLETAPILLSELLKEIPLELYQKQIIKGKWTIHEHATHIATVDLYGFHQRLKDFKSQEYPIIKPMSGDNFEEGFYKKLDLEATIQEFYNVRAETIALAKNLAITDWSKKAKHPEYKEYTPYKMLRHLVLHDYAHLSKIEDMGFRLGYLNECN